MGIGATWEGVIDEHSYALANVRLSRSGVGPGNPYLLLFIYLFIYFWLCRVFIAGHGLSLVAASGGYSSLRCVGFSSRCLLLLRSLGSSVAVAHGLSSCGSRALERRLSSCGARA